MTTTEAHAKSLLEKRLARLLKHEEVTVSALELLRQQGEETSNQLLVIRGEIQTTREQLDQFIKKGP